MSTVIVRPHGQIHRSGTHQVMANSGFGKLVIHRRDGAIIEIPQSQINSYGYVNHSLYKQLQEITPDKIDSLEKRGVKLFVAGKAG